MHMRLTEIREGSNLDCKPGLISCEVCIAGLRFAAHCQEGANSIDVIKQTPDTMRMQAERTAFATPVPAARGRCTSRRTARPRRSLQMQSNGPSVSRRHASLTLALLAGSILPSSSSNPAWAASPPARTVVNGVLSAYGLPTLADVKGFSPLLEQYSTGEVVQFLYPSAWIVSRALGPSINPTSLAARSDAPQRGRTPTLTVGDYRRAEGLALFVSPPSSKHLADWQAGDIALLVTPGDATRNDPEVRVVKDVINAQDGRTIETKFESITASGYSVERRAVARAVETSDGSLWVLCGSCSANRWKKAKEAFDVAIESFQAFRV